MKYPPDSLAAQIGRTVELRFVDGEVVHARLLAIDPDDHEDITCEVVRVIAVGSPPARGGLGRFDEAIDRLEEVYRGRDGDMVLLKTWPAFDPLRSHPRFQRVLRRMNFPE